MIRTSLGRNQAEARDQAVSLTGFGLFAEQRVGKTLTALSIIDQWKPDILLIVCPKKALRVWREQIKEHLEFDWDCQVLRVHFEALCRSDKDKRWWRSRVKKWVEVEGKTVCIVVDEAHRIKGRGTSQSRMIRSLNYVQYRLALTGTPIEGKREDVWPIFDFIQPGVLGATWKEFQDEYLEMGSETIRVKGRLRDIPKLEGYRNVEQFDEIFHRYSYRRTLREAQKESGRTPYKLRRKIVEIELGEESRRVYNELLERLETEVRRKKVRVKLVITLIAKLQQITGGFLIHREPKYDSKGIPLLSKRGKALFDESIIPIGREKLIGLKRYLKSFPSDKKFVICVRYRHEIEAIEKELKKMGRTSQVIAGGSKFDGKFTADTIILQEQPGEAIDLAAADTYIFYSWGYSRIRHEQGRFRVLEFTSRQVNNVYLMAKDTVDEEVYEANVRKKNLAELVCDRYRKRV